MSVTKKDSRGNMNKNFKWIYFVSNRFSLVDRKGSSAVTTRLSALGICFGVMTLIVALSVMNGFQLQFIDSILEISSYHSQVKNIRQDNLEPVLNYLKSDSSVKTSVCFKEAQGLLINNSTGNESPVLVRALERDVLEKDYGFAKEINLLSGDFDLSKKNGIILGSRLSRALNVRVGQEVNLFAMSGSSDTSLISDSRVFTVTGIFSSGYQEINQSFAFVNLDSADEYFGNVPLTIGIKLNNSNLDHSFKKSFEKNNPDLKVNIWREYNRSFFNALKIEKNMLILLVVIIFIVVAINIYNSMRKLVFERRTEISTLSSLGGRVKSIQNVFILRGFMIGIKGALPGLILGLLLSFNIKKVFLLMSKVEFFFTYLSASIFNPAVKSFIRENQMWNVYANIPARVMPVEVIFIVLFGIFSCVFASWAASSNVLKMKIAEVLHEE